VKLNREATTSFRRLFKQNTLATMTPNRKKRKQSGEETKKEDWIKWRDSPAKAVLMDDLRRGVLPRDSQALTAEQAWPFYRRMPEFKKVCFSQFKARLKDHRSQVTKQWRLCQEDEEAFRKDQKRGYRNTRSHNRRGELIIDLSPIKELIREDVQDGKHRGLTPLQFQSTRPEYGQLKPEKFKDRIYQEIRRQKFIFWCELERHIKGRAVPGLYTSLN
jgi:hypothetical protein